MHLKLKNKVLIINVIYAFLVKLFIMPLPNSLDNKCNIESLYFRVILQSIVSVNLESDQKSI